MSSLARSTGCFALILSLPCLLAIPPPLPCRSHLYATELHTDSYYHVDMTILGSLSKGATFWAWSIEEMLMCSLPAHIQGGEGTAVEMNGYPSIHLWWQSLPTGLLALLRAYSDTWFQDFSVFSRPIGPRFYSYKDNMYLHHIWIYYIYSVSIKGARAECLEEWWCPEEWWMTVACSPPCRIGYLPTASLFTCPTSILRPAIYCHIQPQEYTGSHVQYK